MIITVRWTLLALAVGLSVGCGLLPDKSPDDSSTVRDGVVRSTDSQSLQAWDAERDTWVDLEQFWLNYAARSGGLTWGRGADYPAYAQVKEHDTFMVEVEQGPCLMEFFHRRWRRANDVRRWDEAFNQYGGCSHVFD